jgi:prepilin-type N-terminal cleavage/methylation domain-containing protein
MARRRRPIRRRRALSCEAGFTLFELLIAMAVIAIGLIALVSGFDHSRELVGTAEKTEAASHRAERELERILALPWASVGHATAPVHDADTASPAYYVSGANYQWDQGTTGPQSEPLAVDAAGSLGATPTTWLDSEGRLGGEVHRFVTWTGEFCTSADRSACVKRVTVAVTVGGPRPLRRPVLISTKMIDPAATGG